MRIYPLALLILAMLPPATTRGEVQEAVPSGVAAGTQAQSGRLDVRIDQGRVTVHAEGVSIRQILEAWARAGSIIIDNADKMSAHPVSLRLDAVPEREALDIVLRGVSGYVAVGGAPPGSSSMLTRVLILPASTASAVASSAPPAHLPAPEAMADARVEALEQVEAFDTSPAAPASDNDPPVAAASDAMAPAGQQLFPTPAGDAATPGPRARSVPPVAAVSAPFTPSRLPQGAQGGRVLTGQAPAPVPPASPGVHQAPANPFGISVVSQQPGLNIPPPPPPPRPAAPGTVRIVTNPTAAGAQPSSAPVPPSD